MKARLKNYRQSPRKVRLVANLIKGKRLDEAKTLLDYTNKRASKMIKKILSSAEANSGEKAKDLLVKNINVDEGITLKRMRARAMGRGVIVRKRTSNIKVALEKKAPKKTAVAKKATPKKKTTTKPKKKVSKK